MTWDEHSHRRTVTALINATVGDNPELASPVDVGDADVAGRIAAIVLNTLNDDTVLLPRDHVETVVDALTRRLDDFGDVAGIGERTAAGFIVRAIDRLDRCAPAVDDRDLALVLAELAAQHGQDRMDAVAVSLTTRYTIRARAGVDNGDGQDGDV